MQAPNCTCYMFRFFLVAVVSDADRPGIQVQTSTRVSRTEKGRGRWSASTLVESYRPLDPTYQSSPLPMMPWRARPHTSILHFSPSIPLELHPLPSRKHGAVLQHEGEPCKVGM